MRARKRSITPLIGVVVLALAACGEMATLPVSAGIGREPVLPAPNKTLIPTVNIASSKGWPPGSKPQRPELVARAIMPDYALGPHTASLGLAFSAGTTLPVAFASGMFIGQHGSWNRRPHSGYKVIFVPFENGRPGSAPLDVLTGFLSDEGNALGRPVGVVLDKQGALLVADDVGNVVWRVTSQH